MKNFNVKKWMKGLASAGVIAAAVLMTTTVPYAAELGTEVEEDVTAARSSTLSFTNVFVDSNVDTLVTSATATQTKAYAETRITAITPTDGSGDTYNYVKVKATANGTYQRVKKNNGWYEITIPSKLQFVGATIPMYAVGNNSSKDCRITGYWLVY